MIFCFFMSLLFSIFYEMNLLYVMVLGNTGYTGDIILGKLPIPCFPGMIDSVPIKSHLVKAQHFYLMLELNYRFGIQVYFITIYV